MYISYIVQFRRTRHSSIRLRLFYFLNAPPSGLIHFKTGSKLGTGGHQAVGRHFAVGVIDYTMLQGLEVSTRGMVILALVHCIRKTVLRTT